VLVSNHGSYMDGVILVAALPRPFAFVAKRELRDQFVPRVYLQRMGAEYVERFEAQRSVADTSRLVDTVAQGKSLMVFPEGTFVAQRERLPFHLGAFITAARAGVPVVPVALLGTRELLPDGTWWPRRARLGVTVCEPVMPPADTSEIFAAAVRLRDAARRAITLQTDRG
jgi:1-acyl-sn-glycerol-3-phosphate acyltransferase